MTLVPSSRWSGTSVTPSKRPMLRETLGKRKIRVCDDGTLDPHRREVLDAGLHRPVEPAARLPDDERSEPACPVGDLAVVAHDGNRQRTSRLEHVLGHGHGEVSPPLFGEDPAEPALCPSKGFDRDEHGIQPERPPTRAIGRGAPCARVLDVGPPVAGRATEHLGECTARGPTPARVPEAVVGFAQAESVPWGFEVSKGPDASPVSAHSEVDEAAGADVETDAEREEALRRAAR